MKIKSILQFLIIVLIGFSLFSCSFLSRKYEKKETVEYKINTQNKTKLSVNNVSGKFTISRSDSATGLVVKAEKIGHVKKKDLDKPLEDIKINIDTSSDVIVITSETHRGKGWIHFDMHSDEVNYDIRLPQGIKLNIEDVNGDIDLSNISNETNISTVNGKITFSNLTGIHDISTTNGSIKGSIDSIKDFKADVVNGSVALTLGSAFTGNIKADVVNGKITYDKLNLSGVTAEKKMLEGYIGSKQNELRINVVNGKISLTGQSATAKVPENNTNP